jgi:trimeric autotransporter adhesin
LTTKNQKLALAIASAAILSLAGCGGGDGTPASTPAPVQTNTTTSVPVTVIDDAIEKATVCLDKNLNGVCDPSEPSGKTDVAGKVNLQVDPADVGKFPILAVIGLDAIDAKYGPITTAFTLSAPKDQTAVLSPLTTLVQTTIANTGVSTADAVASVQNQTGISVSLFQDFTKSSTPESGTAGQIARMVVITTQQQAAVLNSAVGSSAIDGTVIKSADLDKIIRNKLLEILPELMTSLADPVVQAALKAATTPAQITAALLTPADALIKDTTGLSATSVATLAAINNQTASTAPVAADTATAGATLSSFAFTSAGNWVSRVMSSSLSQATADAIGNVKYVERRYSSVSNAGASWGFGNSPARGSDLHWNGSAWANCAINFENTQSVRDAKGNSSYNYCDSYETGKSNRATFDASGRKMIDVYNEIIAAGYTNLNISSAATVLSNATFPTGSKLLYQTGTALTTAVAYYPGTGNYVKLQDATLAAGNQAACAANPQAAASPNATLAGLVAVNKGTPCVFATAIATGSSGTLTSGARNEGWGQSTLSLGTVGTAATSASPTTSYYTSNTLLNVGFGNGNVANYYSCQQRYNGGGARNCSLIGSGTYDIQTLGDAKTLSFTGLPALTSALAYSRVFVERGGHVYLGYQNKPKVSLSARLNLTGLNAVASQLGIPAINPETPATLTAASYQGAWDFFIPALNGGGPTMTISNTGVGSCVSGGTGNPFTCFITITNPATGAFTETASTGSFQGVFNFLAGTASGTYSDTEVPGTNNVLGTPGTFTGQRR